MDTSERYIELVRKLLPLSPAGRDYVRRQADPTEMDSRRLRSLQSLLRRERSYTAGQARQSLEGILEQVAAELRDRRTTQDPRREESGALRRGRIDRATRDTH